MARQRPLLGVVVIGVGKGGLGSLETVLRALPEDFPVPVVVAYPRAPGVEPELRAMLHAKLPLPVREIEDKDELLPGTLLLAPADYHVLVDGEHVALSTEAPVDGARPAADVLFESASDGFKPRVTAVLLAGEGRDGARGVLAVKRRGGFALVEDPRSIEAPVEARSMPEGATDIADKVLPAPAIAAALLERLAPAKKAIAIEGTP
jgi:two-component system, chemotaxis family, protein-glutamate methylesterase/glutaminase